MTTTFLSNSQQMALQQALIDSKLLNSDSLNSNNSPSPEHKAYSLIAVTLYRFNLHKIKWSSFLKTAISAVANICQWLSNEFVRCQQNYKNHPNESEIIEQSAFFNGVFSEELAYIDTLLGAEVQAK